MVDDDSKTPDSGMVHETESGTSPTPVGDSMPEESQNVADSHTDETDSSLLQISLIFIALALSIFLIGLVSYIVSVKIECLPG
jgi:hypothetical protein